MASPVYVIILNWNGWRDTIECLESVLRMEYDDFRVIVCDNASGDGSTQHILNWAAGREPASVANPALRAFSMPPICKPLKVEYMESPDCSAFDAETDAQLILIENPANLGFAGGCNIGLRYALQHGCSYVWLLNNDTVVSPTALREMVLTAEKDPSIGIVGSKILRYYNPSEVQAYGGTKYCRWMARTPHRKLGESTEGKELDCILGCSMLVSHHFLEQIGLMNECYFLYFEELDWAARSKGKFRLGYAATSQVYHKEGASIGSSQSREKRSLLSERYLSRNRIIFTRRFYPVLLPSVVFWVLAAAVHRVFKGDFSCARTILKAAIDGLRSEVD